MKKMSGLREMSCIYIRDGSAGPLVHDCQTQMVVGRVDKIGGQGTVGGAQDKIRRPSKWSACLGSACGLVVSI